MEDIKDFNLPHDISVRILGAKAHAETGAEQQVQVRSECGLSQHDSVASAINHYAEMALIYELMGEAEHSAAHKQTACEMIRWRNPEMF